MLISRFKCHRVQCMYVLHQPHQPVFHRRVVQMPFVFPKTWGLSSIPNKKWREKKHGVLRCLSFSFMIHNTQQDLKTNTKLLSISWFFGYLEKKISRFMENQPPSMFKRGNQLFSSFHPNFHRRLLGLNSEVPTIWRDSMDPILVSCPSYVPGRRIGMPIMGLRIIPYNQGGCFSYFTHQIWSVQEYLSVFKIESGRNVGPSFWVDLSPRVSTWWLGQKCRKNT